jgi:hypothetical protein
VARDRPNDRIPASTRELSRQRRPAEGELELVISHELDTRRRAGVSCIRLVSHP